MRRRRCCWEWSCRWWSFSTSLSLSRPGCCGRSSSVLLIMLIHYCQLLLLLMLILVSSSLDGVSSQAVHRPHMQRPQPKKIYTTSQLQTEMGRNITRILNSFFSSGYDKRVRPSYADKPVVIGVTLHIISISSVSEVQMDFTCDFYFRQGWRDPRLSFHPTPNLKALFVGADVAKQIWVPDTFFANEKSAQFHTATTPNTFIRINANGQVIRSTRLTVTSSCPMNLQYFPMDRQYCTIEVESYGYSMADIVYRWGIEKENEKAAASMGDVSLPQFRVKELTQDAKVEYLTTGNYSRLICKLEFVRSMGYYLIQIYIPASLIVIISWVSFWLHRNASPARVQLGVTTVLTMTTLMSSTNAALPKISYIKSIDVFLGTCFVMVFAALLEYATVGYMGKRIAMRTSKGTASTVPSASGQRSKLTFQQQQQQLHHRAMMLKMQATAAAAAGITSTSVNFMEMGQSSAWHQQQPFLGRVAPPPHAYFGRGDRPGPWPSLLPRLRSISAFQRPQMRYRLNSSAGTHLLLAASSSTTNNGAPATSIYDFSQKKISLAPPDSELGGGGGVSTATPNTPTPRDPSSSSSNPITSSSSSHNSKNAPTIFGLCPSDIDKMSRVVFPICFLCFNLAYWIIYMHISEFLSVELER